MAFDNQPASESTNGKQIAVVATATAGTLLHTATAGSNPDAITIQATNIDTVNRTLTIEWGGVATADQIIVGIPPKTGYTLVVNGRLLKGGLAVRAFADSASKINCNVSVVSST